MNFYINKYINLFTEKFYSRYNINNILLSVIKKNHRNLKYQNSFNSLKLNIRFKKPIIKIELIYSTIFPQILIQ